MNTLQIAQATNELAILSKVSQDTILERAKEIRDSLPKKERSKLSINRSGINKATEIKLCNFDSVYKETRVLLGLPTRCTQKSINQNLALIKSKFNGLTKQNDKELFLSRLEKVMTNRNLLVSFMTNKQKEQYRSKSKKYTTTFILDLLKKVCTLSESNYTKCVTYYNNEVRIAKLKAKFA